VKSENISAQEHNQETEKATHRVDCKSYLGRDLNLKCIKNSYSFITNTQLKMGKESEETLSKEDIQMANEHMQGC
jgi:hypothetical protein